MSAIEADALVRMTGEIVAAHVANNNVPISDIGSLITKVHGALNALAAPPAPEPEKPRPAISLRAAIRPESIGCLDCGSRQKMLRRHLMTRHQMTPEQYRQRWDLGQDYPLVASDYSERRRDLAKAHGLGTKRNRSR